MAHEDLVSYFKLNFALMQHHKYSLTELENMIPWEREIYVALLQQYVEEENLKAQQERNGRRTKFTITNSWKSSRYKEKCIFKYL